ncbi:hypothetical protein K1719_009385 [Acacia pycnantha]|nr:hypothetical protein K1719_009385 [Acacia pycnantha]
MWLQLLPGTSVDHLPKVHSDHRPISTKLGLRSQSNPISRPFRFLAPWLSHPDFPLLVQRVWSNGDDLLSCIKSFTTESIKWNLETFGFIGQRKRILLHRLNGIQSSIENRPNAPSDFLIDLETSLGEDLEEVCFQEELLWLQKSSSEWLCLGDRNTKYYHTKALIRKKRNHFSQLRNMDGDWISNDEDLSSLARQFFVDLYSLADPVYTPFPLQGAFPTLGASQILALERMMISSSLAMQQLLKLF